MSKRIVGIGGGSGFFVSVLKEMAMTEELAGCEFVLYDIDADAVRLMENLGRRVFEKTGADIKLRSTTNRDEALEWCDYVVSSIGAMGPNMEAHDADMKIAARHGIVQTTGDTVGPGGLSIALRIIPGYVELGREIAKRSPDCVFLNHSNPMGAICRSLIKHAGLKRVVGLCHGVQGTERYLAEVLDVPRDELHVVCAGLNHMLWVQAIRHKGRDMMPALREKMAGHKEDDGHRFAWKMFDVYGHFPVNNDRHIIEFYPYLRQCSKPEDLPYNLEFRSEMLVKSRKSRQERDEKITRQGRGEEEVELPKEVSPENIGALIGAMITGRRDVRILNLQNEGCIPNMPDFANVELQGATEDGGVRGLCMGPLPDNVVGSQIARAYQTELVVDAAVKGDRSLALQALCQDPLILSIEDAESLLDDLLQAQKDYLPWVK